MEDFEEQKRYERAKEHVKELREFYNNLITYILVIGSLAAINYYQNKWEYAWFLWPSFGWGIGIVFHATKAFKITPVFRKEWEEKKIKKYMEEEQKEKTQLWE